MLEIKKKLFDRNISTGSKWVKTDFHIHCPGSSDYEYSGADSYHQLAKTLTDLEYGFAVVLKHQEFPAKEEIARLQSLCPKTKIIPGAELNIFVDAIEKKVGKNYFFHCILAVSPDTDQPFNFILHEAKKQFSYRTDPNDYPSGFTSSISDIGKFFLDRDAIFLPAHLHQSKKPENSRSIDDIYTDDAFLRWVENKCFSALEVRVASTSRFFNGTTKSETDILIPHAVCVQSSDAHKHQHIIERNRYTWTLVENNTFEELRAALAYSHRVSIDDPMKASTTVDGVLISGSFLPETCLPMNSGINAMIGCKGSGKTSILESLRFLFGTEIPVDRRDKVQTHITHILGPSGKVECQITGLDGKKYLLARRADSPTRLSITDESGETNERESIRDIFEITILGWHEIEAVADSASARIGLIDRVGDGSKVREFYLRISEFIDSARDDLPVLQQKLKRLDDALHAFWDLQDKRAKLEKLDKADLTELQTQYEWFLNTQQILTGYLAKIKKHKSRLDGQLPFNLITEFQSDFSSSIPEMLADKFSETEVLLTSIKESDNSSLKELKLKRDQLVEHVALLLNNIDASFKTFRQEVYNPKVEELPQDERDILTRQIQILEETRELPQKEEECDSLHREVIELSRSIESNCVKVCTARDDICNIRSSTITELNSELDNLELTFNRSGNQNKLERYRKRLAGDSDSFLSVLSSYQGQETYEKLRNLFEELRKSQLTRDRWQFSKLIWDLKFAEFLDVVDDDDVTISFLVGNAGYIPLQNLSAGQRCTAVFPILLRNAKGPLIIDQPEDNLDNRHIADVIAPDLLRRKSSQQFLLTSHNANLVVLTDADLIIHMDSDGSKGFIENRGFLACPSSKIRSSVLDVLDGGYSALEARRLKYGTKVNEI
jgi:DNA repair ATPase RecN